MIEKLIEWDKELFLLLNSHHHPMLDPMMFYLSDKLIWIPLYIFLLYIILKNYRADSWAPLVGILVMIVLSDQINTSILKPLVQRLRPTHDPSLASTVHIVKGYYGGKFGFASSHASNTFALATFFWVLLKKEHPWLIILFVWAAAVSYSRVYLGVHFPGDVFTGIIIGIAMAFLGLRISRALLNYSYRRKQSAHR
jgi:undecaprenyl-diphosphatase